MSSDSFSDDERTGSDASKVPNFGSSLSQRSYVELLHHRSCSALWEMAALPARHHVPDPETDAVFCSTEIAPGDPVCVLATIRSREASQGIPPTPPNRHQSPKRTQAHTPDALTRSHPQLIGPLTGLAHLQLTQVVRKVGQRAKGR